MFSSEAFDIEVSSKELASCLSAVTAVIEKRNVEQTLSCVKLFVSEDKLCVEATDGSIFIRQFLGAKIQNESLNLIVEGRILERMIRGLADEFIRILYIPESNELLLSSISFELRLIALSPNSFPTFPVITSPVSFEILSSDLFDLINCTDFSLSKDEIRYNINGIYIYGANNQIHAASTDNFRLSAFNLESKGVHNNFAMILPTKTVSFLKNLNASSPGQEVLKVTLHHNIVQFSSPKMCIVSKLIDGSFPEYTSIIPKNNDNNLIIQKSHLASAIERIAFITDDNSRAVKMSISEKEVEISAYTHSKGKAKQVIEHKFFKYKGEPLTIAFQPRYVLDILSLIKQADAKVTIALKSSSLPVLITSDQLSRCLFVIMLIKIT